MSAASENTPAPSPYGWKRTLLALLNAPIWGGMVAFTLSMIPTTASMNGSFWQYVELVPTGGVAGFLFGVPCALILGWPAYLLLRRLRWSHPLVYVCCGAALGVASAFTFMGLALVLSLIGGGA